jgi:hypothetical protein
VAESNERPFQQLVNSVLVTGDDEQIFEESEDEQMLAAYILLDALVSNDLPQEAVVEPNRWFNVDLTPVSHSF